MKAGFTRVTVSGTLILIVSFAIVSFAAAPLCAEGNEVSSTAAEVMTIEEARELALANSKTLQKALLSVDSALLAEKAQSYTQLPQPSLSVNGGLSYPVSSGSSLASGLGVSANVSVTQNIYEGGKNKILAAIDSLATQSARSSARAEYLSVLESTDAAYYGVLEAQAAVDAAEQDLAASKLHQDIAQAKFDAGIVIKSTVIEAQAETAEKQTALSQARKTLLVELATLKKLTGKSAKPKEIAFATYDTPMAKLSALDDTSADAFVGKLYATALTNNPTLSTYSLALSQAQKQVDVAKAAYLPTVAASLSHTASYSASDGLDLASDGALSVTVSIPLDFLTLKNTVQTKTVSAKQAQLDSDEAADSLQLEIQSGVYGLIAAVRSVSSSQKALEYAQSNYDVVLQLYKLSKASSSDLSDAQLLVSSNRSSYISARYAFLADISTLKTLTGLESESALLAMIQ